MWTFTCDPEPWGRASPSPARSACRASSASVFHPKPGLTVAVLPTKPDPVCEMSRLHLTTHSSFPPPAQELEEAYQDAASNVLWPSAGTRGRWWPGTWRLRSCRASSRTAVSST